MRHFVEELAVLQRRLLEMAGLVEHAIRLSVRSVEERDPAPANQVLQKEPCINRMEIEIDEIATNLLALQQPMACDLRFLTAAIKINNDLERMGDLAVNIAERALSLISAPAIRPQIDLPYLAGTVQSMVSKSLDAFVKRDAGLARTVLLSDDEVDTLRDAVYEELLAFMQRDPPAIPRALDLILVARNLERLADHATNIAEDVLFFVEGVDVRHHAEVQRD